MSQEVPLVSVVVITYNHDRYIKQAIESILMQVGNFDLELIVSNDTSTDNTHYVIEQTLSCYTGNFKIQYFNQPQNLGIVQNLIFTLRNCSGNFIAVCEGDDYWTDSQKLQKQIAVMHTHKDCSMVITNRLVISEDESTYDELYDTYHGKSIFSTADIVNEFIPGTQTFFFKKYDSLTCFLANNHDLDHADRYITYYCSLLGKIYLLPEVTAAYRLTGKGAWSENNGIEKLQTKARQLEDFHKRIGMPLENLVLARIQLSCAIVTLKYCLKRPSEFRNKANAYWIKKSWAKFPNIKRIKILLGILFPPVKINDF